MNIDLGNIISFIVGGITFPSIVVFFKAILNYHTWKVVNYKRKYDPYYEFYPGYHTETDEHEFIVENSSNTSWTFDDFEWNGEQSLPYLFINKKPQGRIALENTDSFEAVFPSHFFDGSDYPVGKTVVSPKECITIILQHTDNISKKPIKIRFKKYSDSNSLISRWLTFSWIAKSKIELQIP